jgi:hypothetical protein
MNEHEELDRDELERATSRSLADGAPRDSRSAALRDGWLALGRAVESGNAGFREDVLLERLSARCASQPSPQPALVEPAAKSTSLPLWPLLLGAALALAMMVAVVRTLNLGSTGGTVVPPPLVVQEHPSVPAPIAPESAEAPAAIAAWTDPLDDEIEQALTQLRSAASRSGGVDDSLTALQTQLQQLSADLAGGSL